MNLSTCHSLRLIDVDAISTWRDVDGQVTMTVLGNWVRADEIPGTIQVTETLGDDGVRKKKITWTVAAMTQPGQAKLRALASIYLVAAYVDQRGSRRLCGSPDYPLKLTFTAAEGVYLVTLEGMNTGIDTFLARV